MAMRTPMQVEVVSAGVLLLLLLLLLLGVVGIQAKHLTRALAIASTR